MWISARLTCACPGALLLEPDGVGGLYFSRKLDHFGHHSVNDLVVSIADYEYALETSVDVLLLEFFKVLEVLSFNVDIPVRHNLT